MGNYVYDSLKIDIEKIITEENLFEKEIFLFGYCDATIRVIDILLEMNLTVRAILDNSCEKQEMTYKGIKVIYPTQINEKIADNYKKSIVLISSRFYEVMVQQLHEIGYRGGIRKVIDYNSYAEYSLAENTILRMQEREQYGELLLDNLKNTYPEHFRVFCPFNALGDVYFMISYWSEFANVRNISNVVFCVLNSTLMDVIHLFGEFCVKVYNQKDLDAMIQASIYTKDKNSFIAHQDRPYVINLHNALYKKKIPLEKIYCCGVYGLPWNTIPTKPGGRRETYKNLDSIPEGKAVIFSPYAKSVTAIDSSIWESAVEYYNAQRYKCYTNICNDEVALDGTEGISPSILEIGSVVERAGTFIGIRSGLCDVLREVKAKKIALYPNYYYCDTKWKAIDMYYIEQFNSNILVEGEIEWEKL